MIAFTVEGDPQTKGSAKAFKHRTTGRIIVWNDNDKCKPWAAKVKQAAFVATRGGRDGFGAAPVHVDATFAIRRPKKTKLHTPRLDIDKLLRALLDALKAGAVYVDDKQVASVTARKEWGEPGVSVTVRAVEVPR